MVKEINILWVDDEIDLLRPYILFLEEKGYNLVTAANGQDAIRIVERERFDLIFLDENMPGLSGLETLDRIKKVVPSVPVIMITKNEEEDIMDEALGSKISDYLIKPVNPKQILLTIKKNIDTRRLITAKTTSNYQMQFGQIGLQINTAATFTDWTDIYSRLVFWERELEKSRIEGMDEILQMQKQDANKEFCKFVKANYFEWFSDHAVQKPLMSPNLFARKIFPLLESHKVVVVLIDNLRFDQWKIIEEEIHDYFTAEKEELYCSILPTATQYARNSIFAGLMPMEIDQLYPEYWIQEEEAGSKNPFEKELLQIQMQRAGIRSSLNYEKISNQKSGKKIVENYKNLLNYDLSVLVYNFVDMLSHARTEMDMIKELAYDEASYRSITTSWFQHSYLLELLKLLSGYNIKLVVTTDHGSVRVKNPVKVIGDRNTSANLRYKMGKNLNYNPKVVFEVQKPELIHLPKSNVSSTYIFSYENDYMVYPNNYNYFVNYYRNTFQHGGVSLEEMLIPVIILLPNA